eukprot:scaffold6027_cov117-Isochrysis_galbana.AAC.5
MVGGARHRPGGTRRRRRACVCGLAVANTVYTGCTMAPHSPKPPHRRRGRGHIRRRTLEGGIRAHTSAHIRAHRQSQTKLTVHGVCAAPATATTGCRQTARTTEKTTVTARVAVAESVVVAAAATARRGRGRWRQRGWRRRGPRL